MTPETVYDSEAVREYVFTFGPSHEDKNGKSLGHKYVVIKGTWESARMKLHALRNGKWAFQYDSRENAGVYKYDLEEVETWEL